MGEKRSYSSFLTTLDIAACKTTAAPRLRVALPNPDRASESLGERRRLQLGAVLVVLGHRAHVRLVVSDDVVHILRGVFLRRPGPPIDGRWCAPNEDGRARR